MQTTTAATEPKITTVNGKRYLEVTTAADVTEAVLKQAEETLDGYYADEPRIDWEDFLTRMEGSFLHEGEWLTLDLGGDMMSPAIRKIQKHVRACRAQG